MARLVIGVALALCASLAWQTLRLHTTQGKLEQAQRTVAVLEIQRDNAREAQAVAEAHRQRVAQQADEYDAMRESLLRGDENAELPVWFRDWLLDLGVGVRSPD